jgi:predicted ATPase/DNA-binding CsgD family transcriptional regulator
VSGPGHSVRLLLMARAEPGAGATPWASLTSFVGRDHEAADLAKMVRERRLVTVTGPGGVGKTRLAAEVARQAVEDFPDGVYFVGLGAVREGARVADEVAASLGVQRAHARSSADVLAEVLATRRLLLVLDNCEHVLADTAQLCGRLLNVADDLCILATSREQLWVAGETRYRLEPLALPASADPAAISGSAAVTLFAERARQVEPRFTLAAETIPLAAHVVARLDGMPLAIELAAARVEALGMAGLALRIDDALRLLNTKDATAAARHQSLAAVADWSYQLLSLPEQRVFRRLSMFPGAFTLEGAEAVAGTDAGPVVLRLVDCSLVAPPRPGPDKRMRYTMLETLRAYARDQLMKAGEEDEAMAGVVRFALSVTEDAWAGLQTSDGDADALRSLDAEDATVNRALSWALENSPDDALRIASALGPWWRGHCRLVEGYERLTAAVAQTTHASPGWARAQLWLGYLCRYGELADSLAHYTAAITAGVPREAVDALVGRTFRRVNNGLADDAESDAGRALTLATQHGYPAGQAQALAVLAMESATARRPGFEEDALAKVREARDFLSAAATPGWLARWCEVVFINVLTQVGDVAAARRACAAELAKARAAGDLTALVNLLAHAARTEWQAGAMASVRAHVSEAMDVAGRLGDHSILRFFMNECAEMCAATGYQAEAVTLWAALAAEEQRAGINVGRDADDQGLNRELRRQATEALPAQEGRLAAARGARMPLAAAVEYMLMLTERQATVAPREIVAPATASELTERERELVTLVAQCRTNAQIAAELYISIRTVGSHLDRIRAKTSYRRRADLTRLALSEGLV